MSYVNSVRIPYAERRRFGVHKDTKRVKWKSKSRFTV